MKSNVKKKAVLLREKGFSFKEISDKLGISKSTASLWLRGVKLSGKAKKRIAFLGDKGRAKSVNTNRKRRLALFKTIDKNCTVLLQNNGYDSDDFKLFLSLLYWGEGAKTGRRVVFINSDPVMIKTYLFLLRNSFKINDDKIKASLHLHSYHNRTREIAYWSGIAQINPKNIGIYKKTNSGKRKKKNYRGCISLRYGDSKILDEINIILKRFKNIAGVG